MVNVLLVYSTTDGHTAKICQYLQELIVRRQHQVCLRELTGQPMPDLMDFDIIVIGASIRYGHHSKKVFQFINTYEEVLNQRKNAFFSVNLVARKAGKNQPHNNPYMKLFLGRIRWQPQYLEVFAGKLNYPAYRFWDRQIIRLIMWLTGGPTAAGTVIEYTDWQQVAAFAKLIAAL